MIPSRGLGNQSTKPPSHKELNSKLARAKELITSGDWLPAEPTKLKDNFDELEKVFTVEITLEEDQQKILLDCLNEITPEHYAGQRPPQRAYEPVAKNLEMYAFCWDSPAFQGMKMYFKFSLTKAGTKQKVIIFSVHSSRKE